MKTRLYFPLLSCLIGLTGFTVATGEPLPAKGPPLTAEQIRNLRLRDRFRDYEGKIKADHTEEIKRWGRLFLENRDAAMAVAAKDLATLANAIRKERSLDATQLKWDPEFHKALTDKIKALLAPDPLKGDLKTWAEGVEIQTRD